MTREEIRNQLPKVGDVRMEKPTDGDAAYASSPQKCVVVEVSEQGLWYRVKFLSSGANECYRLPRARRSHGRGSEI